MKIFIVGSKGFIGSHLTSTMRASGYTVIESPVKGDANVPNVWMEQQVSKISNFLKFHQPDICVNCSGAAHVLGSFDEPLLDFSRNTVDVYQILDAIRIHSPHTRFVHLSSAAVYGSPKVLPISETSATNPVSPYGFHKLASENFCREFTMLYGIKTTSLRIFSAYGPGLRKQILWDFYQKWKQSQVIDMFGTGEETRDFVFIDDLCSAIETVIRDAPFNGEAINIASGVPISIRDIVTILASELGGRKKIRFVGQKRTGDPDYWHADISFLKELGFVSSTSIETGIKVTAQWQKENG